jgi:thioredoxin reductase (NADPH)
VRRDLRSRYREDYTIMSAASGEEALATIRELKARGDLLALVISDQRMPGLQGTDLLAESRKLYPQTRRVLLTAYADIDAAIKAINVAHLDHYLSKPWSPPEDHLFPVVDTLLQSWQNEHLDEAKGLRLVGHQWSPRTHEIKKFLAGNVIAYHWLDVDRDPDAKGLLDAAGIDPGELPALLFEDGSKLANPDLRQVAERLGRSQSASLDLYDLVIVGAGPAGLAAAVYGASEGLRTLLLERQAPGGQAGSSSKIENYLGFPTGVAGSELTRVAVFQARRLGAELLLPIEVTGVSIDAGYKHVALGDGRTIVARTLLAATGMEYREHPADGMAAHTGAGVYYGAATAEAQVCSNRRVLIVGGGNSAGQAAMHLSQYADDVQIVVRRDSLRDTMSQYLIKQIEDTKNIRLRPRTALERVEGNDHVERVVLREGTGATEIEPMDAVFVFIGTKPRSAWLPPDVLRDARGFVITGRDLAVDPRYAGTWKERRPPMLLETSAPGVFAAGDIRAGAINRVASAVGEGSMAVRFVHEYLAQV